MAMVDVNRFIMDSFHSRGESCPVRSGSGQQQPVDSNDFQAKHWAYLFGSLERSVDQMYQSCEVNENLIQCKEVMVVLENYSRDFHSLAEWLRIKWEYENSQPPQRQNYIALEIRRPWKTYSGYHRSSGASDNYSKPSNSISKQVEIQGYKSGHDNSIARGEEETIDCAVTYDPPQYHQPIVVDPVMGNHLYQTSMHAGTNVGAAVFIPPEAYPELYVHRTIFDSQSSCNHVESNFSTKRHDHSGKHSYPTFPDKNSHCQVAVNNVESVSLNQSHLDPIRSNERFGKNIGSRHQKKSALQHPFNICNQRKRTKQCSKSNYNTATLVSPIVLKKGDTCPQDSKPVSCEIQKNMPAIIDCIEDAFMGAYSKCGFGVSNQSSVNLNQTNGNYIVNFAVAKLDAAEERNIKIFNDCFQKDENQNSFNKFDLSVSIGTQTSTDFTNIENSVPSKNEISTNVAAECKTNTMVLHAGRVLASNTHGNIVEGGLSKCYEKTSVQPICKASQRNIQNLENRGSEKVTLFTKESKSDLSEKKNTLILDGSNLQAINSNNVDECIRGVGLPLVRTEKNNLEVEKNIKREPDFNIIVKRDIISENRNSQDLKLGQNLPTADEKFSVEVPTYTTNVNSLPGNNPTESQLEFNEGDKQSECHSNMKWGGFEINDESSSKDCSESLVEESFSSQSTWKNIENTPENERNSPQNEKKFLFSLSESERMIHFPALGSSTAVKRCKESTDWVHSEVKITLNQNITPKQDKCQPINFAKIVGSVSTKKFNDLPKSIEDDMKEKEKPKHVMRQRSSFIQDSNGSLQRLRFSTPPNTQLIKESETRDNDGWERVKSKPRWKDDSTPQLRKDFRNLPLHLSPSYKTKFDLKQNDEVKSYFPSPVRSSSLQSKVALPPRPQKTQSRTPRNQRTRPQNTQQQRDQIIQKQSSELSEDLKTESHSMPIFKHITVEPARQSHLKLFKENIFMKEQNKSEYYFENKLMEDHKLNNVEPPNFEKVEEETVLKRDINNVEGTDITKIGSPSATILCHNEHRAQESPFCHSDEHLSVLKSLVEPSDSTEIQQCGMHTFFKTGNLSQQNILSQGESYNYYLEENKHLRSEDVQEQRLNSNHEVRSELDLEELRINEEEIRKSNELHEEELMLTRKIQDLQLADFDEILDTETDETDVDCEGEQSVEVDPSQIHQAYNQYLQSIPWSDQIDEMEKLASIIGSNRDTTYEPASLEQFKELVARHPRRALELHLKLSSRSKREGSEEKNVARRQKADEKRQQLLSHKAAKMRELVQKVEEVKAQQNLLAQERKYRLDLKLKKAEENRNQHLSIIRRKAHDEEEKLKEIAFINELEAQNRRHESMALRQEQEERLQSIIEERQRKVGEKAAKEAAVEERRRVLEAERQEKLEKMQEKRRKKEEIIGRKQQEKEKERLVIAREKAREREERLQARQAAQLATAEELQKKIQQKQENSARRHEENIELIRQKALETGMLRSIAVDEDSYHSNFIKHGLSDDTRKGELKIKVVDNEKGKAIQRKRMKKLRSRMSSRGADFLSSYNFKDLDTCSESILSITGALKELEPLSNMNPANWSDLDTSTQLEKCLNDVIEILQKRVDSDLIAFREYKGFCILSKFVGFDEGTDKDRSTQLSVRCFIKVCSLYGLSCAGDMENAKYMILSNNISLLFDSLRYKLNNFFSKNKSSNIGILLYALKAILFPLSAPRIGKAELEMKLNDLISYVVCCGLVNRISDLIYYVSVNDGNIFFELLAPALEFLTAFTKLSIQNEEYLEVLRSTDLMGTISLLYGVLQAKPKCLPPFTSQALQFLLAIAGLDIHLFQEVLGAEGVCLQFRHTAKFLLKFCSKEEKLETVLHSIIQIIGFFAVHNRNNQEILVSGNLPTVISQLLGLPFQYYAEPPLHQILFPTLIACCYNNETNNAIVKVEMNVNLLDNFLMTEDAQKSRVVQLFLNGDGEMPNR